MKHTRIGKGNYIIKREKITNPKMTTEDLERREKLKEEIKEQNENTNT